MEITNIESKQRQIEVLEDIIDKANNMIAAVTEEIVQLHTEIKEEMNES